MSVRAHVGNVVGRLTAVVGNVDHDCWRLGVEEGGDAFDVKVRG